ncbi:uncharacterized protein EAF01_008319 [Botrytis porri]|uniref:uncharacterized protein n=1 Tax=Botrytis porri TaxID=87229 RepID=UPI00190190C6|nr:uncharacterized protein EAF01_008319 [Botrytis porri]KAF7899106.1 hypothetical protein EAF01_008319 [Botrytis porri]
MAPEQSASPPGRRRTGANRENQYLFNLGVKGRKTGVELPDTGIRDANGLEPMDDLFSPDKPESIKTSRSANGPRRNALEDATISSEEDMDMDGENTAPEPTEVLNQRRQDARLALPIPRSRSPLKTHLQSPARRHPSFGISSPAKEASSEADDTGPVRRKLDFSADDIAVETKQATSAPNGRGKPGRPALGNLTNGTRLSPGRLPPQTLNQSSDGMENQDESALEFEDDSNQYNAPDDEDDDAAVDALEGNSDLVEAYGEQEAEEEIEQVGEPEPEPSPPRKAASKNKGKGKGKVIEEPEPEEVPELEQPPPKRRGRKPKNSAPQIEPVEEERKEIKERPTKKARRSAEPVEAPEPTKRKPGKPGRPSNATKSTYVPKAAAKSKGRSHMAPIPEVDSPLVHRGPPIPRKNGLYILRRETALGGTGMLRTRSGRNSMKPLAFWKGEHVEYDDDGTVPDGTHGAKILLPSIKEVVRVDEVEQEKRSRPKYQKSSKSKSKKRVREEVDEDSETEEWESQTGRVEGSVRIWDPEDQVGENAAEKVEDVAFSSAAIKTRDIPNASFKFAKTLTLPFFGSGMVDLEPGAVKKPKNSRKMQMVFFVFYGRVEVSVNETTFRIGKGGMWQVPRARIFFAQGCELEDSEGGAAPPASQ